ARRIGTGVPGESPGEAIATPCGSARHAEPVLPAQRRPERVALLERVELLHEVLPARSLCLLPERAPAVPKPRVEVVAVHAAEIGRPVCRFRTHPALDIALPTRGAWTTALRVDQEHARVGARAVHRRSRRARKDRYALDIVRLQAVQR